MIRRIAAAASNESREAAAILRIMAASAHEAYPWRNLSEAILSRKSVFWLVAIAVIAIIAAYFARGQIALAEIGTGFAAKETCSCLFVSRRQLDSCKRDYDPVQARLLS